MKTAVFLFLSMVLYSSCSNTNITGRYELSGGRNSFSTPVLSIPKFITLKPDGTFDSSTLLHGTFEINRGKCSLTTSDKTTGLGFIIKKSIFGGIKLIHNDEVYYERVKK